MFGIFDYLKSSWQAVKGTATDSNELGSQMRILENRKQEFTLIGLGRYLPKDVNEEIYTKFLMDFCARENISIEEAVPKAYALWNNLAKAELIKKNQYYVDNYFDKAKALRAKNQLKSPIKKKAVSKSKKRTSAARKPKRTAANKFKYSSSSQQALQGQARKRKSDLKLIKPTKKQQNRRVKRPQARNPVIPTTSFADMAATNSCSMQLYYDAIQVLEKIMEIHMKMEKLKRSGNETAGATAANKGDKETNQNTQQNCGSLSSFHSVGFKQEKISSTNDSFHPVSVKQEKISSTSLREVPVKIFNKKYGPKKPLIRSQSKKGEEPNQPVIMENQIPNNNSQIRGQKQKLTKVVHKLPKERKEKKIQPKKPKHKKTIRVKHF